MDGPSASSNAPTPGHETEFPPRNCVPKSSIWERAGGRFTVFSRLNAMPDDFPYDVFLSHSAKDKAVVRPLAERLRADGRFTRLKKEIELLPSSFLIHPFQGAPLNKERRFLPLRLDDAPIKGSLAQFRSLNFPVRRVSIRP